MNSIDATNESAAAWERLAEWEEFLEAMGDESPPRPVYDWMRVGGRWEKRPAAWEVVS